MQNPNSSKSPREASDNGGDVSPLEPGLYLVSTPLGNARDITLRALDVLKDAEVLVAEDTRTLRRLMEIHGLALNGRRVVAYHDHSGTRDRDVVLRALDEGKSVAYASEAGTPLVADPGYQLVQGAIAADHKVIPVTGASAMVAAISIAGLPSNRFTFLGFPPQQKSARRRFFEGETGTPGTLILYESPKRLGACLADAADALGADRPAAICRELTKKFEETRRGTLKSLSEEYAETPPKGEIVVLIGEGETTIDMVDVEAALRRAMESQKLKDAAREVADHYGLSRRDLYQLGLTFD